MSENKLVQSGPGSTNLGDGNQEEVYYTLIPSDSGYPGDDIHFGETITSLRAMMQKPYQLVNIPGGSAKLTPYNYLFSYCDYYSRPFIGVAASVRYKIFPQAATWISIARIPASQTTTTSIVNPTLAPTTYSGPNLGVEVLVPYYEPVRYEKHYATYDAAGTNITYDMIRQWKPTGTFTEMVCYKSYGPDIRVAPCWGIPPIKFDKSQTMIPFWSTSALPPG